MPEQPSSPETIVTGDDSPQSKISPLPMATPSDLEKYGGFDDAVIQELVNEDSTGIVMGQGPHSGGRKHLRQTLTSRHIQMIGIGGALGSGLLVSLGTGLQSGGPVSCLIAFAVMGLNLGCTMFGLGEMAAALPISGSFAAYSARFIDPKWGFAMGWNYWMGWVVTLPVEVVAATVAITFWDSEGKVSPGIWVALLLLLLIISNVFGVRFYGEVEYAASFIKLLAVVGFSICGIVIKSGSTPAHLPVGFQTWSHGLAFQNGFRGLSSAFVLAAFAYAGAELVGLAAAETANPRIHIPRACKQIFWKLAGVYVVAILIVSLIVPADSSRLVGLNSYDTHSSPFIVALELGGINILPAIFNAFILVAVLSVANSSVYGSSRTLLGMAQSGLAPRYFAKVDARGRPLRAILLSISFGGLAFLVYSNAQATVFTWLFSLSGLSCVFTWGSINACHLRFRAAWTAQGKSLESLPWQSPLRQWGSYLGAALNLLVLVTTFYSSAFPIDQDSYTTSERAALFFQTYLAVPIVLLFYGCGWFFIKGRGWAPLDELDITTGQRDSPSIEQLRAERAEAALRPLHQRILENLL